MSLREKWERADLFATKLIEAMDDLHAEHWAQTGQCIDFGKLAELRVVCAWVKQAAFRATEPTLRGEGKKA